MTINKILPNYTDWNQRIFGDKINELVDVVNSLTGGESHEHTDGICQACRPKPEPKSNTLREDITRTILLKHPNRTDQILSLVKVHLLAELPEADKGGMSLGSIKQIIKNL